MILNAHLIGVRLTLYSRLHILYCKEECNIG